MERDWRETEIWKETRERQTERWKETGKRQRDGKRLVRDREMERDSIVVI